MATQIIIRNSDFKSSMEVIACLKNVYNRTVFVEPSFKEASFLVSPRLGVTKVKGSEMFNQDKREEIIKMANTMNDFFVRPFFIIEGRSNWSKYGDTVLALLARSNISVLFASESADTAMLLNKLLEEEIKQGHFLPNIFDMPHLSEINLEFYSKLPGTNYGLALLMAKNFKNPAELISADPKTIGEKLEINLKRAQSIFSFCHNTVEGKIEK